MVEYLEDFFGTTTKWGKETSDGKYFICNFFLLENVAFDLIVCFIF